MPSIYFFRNPIDNDPYESLFGQHGWETCSIPVLGFKFVNREEILEVLSHPELFSGLVITSSRVIQALHAHAIRSLEAWVNKPVYVVGPATSKAVKSLGLAPAGEGAGNAEALAHVIASQHNDTDRSLLFLCGSSRRDELPTILEHKGIPLQEQVIYHTHPIEHLDLESRDVPDHVVFFSPSGVQAVLKHWPVHWETVKCTPLGPRTAEALKEAGKQITAIPTHPTPEALLTTINTKHETRNTKRNQKNPPGSF